MKEQFTPGKWGFQANDSYIELHAGGKMIGDRSMGSNTCTEAELKANAQLFKVAPKMYEMLKKFLPCDEDGNGKGDFLYSDGSEFMGDEVTKLLAEARGEK